MKVTLFTYKSRRNKDGEFPVYLRVAHKGERFLVSTGITCECPVEQGQFSRKERNVSAKRRRLEILSAEIEDIILRNPDENTNRLKSLISEHVKPEKKAQKNLLYDAVISFSKLKSGRTVGLYEQTAKKVLSFDGKATLDGVGTKWLQNFEAFCSTTMKVNSVAIHLRNLRAVFNWCIEEGKTENYPFKTFKVRHEKTRKRSLSVKELRILRDYPCEDFQKPYRDIFMLMFYLMGINAKDLLHLKPKDLRNGRIEYVRYKTGKRYSVKVEPEAMAIIKRYKGKNWLINPLDRYKDHMNWLHHMNDALKTIGKEYKAGRKPSGNALYDDLSSYWARHTWGTLAAEIDTPIDVIAHALGHSIPGLDVTSIYIRFNEKKIDKANRAVIDFVNKE